MLSAKRDAIRLDNEIEHHRRRCLALCHSSKGARLYRGYTGTLIETDNAPSWDIIEYLQVDGNRANAYQPNGADVFLWSCAYCQIAYLTFTNAPNFSVEMTTDVPTAVENSTFTNAYHSAIYTPEGLCSSAVYWYPHYCQFVVENQISSSGGGGIGMNSSNIEIDDNTFSGNGTTCEDGAGAGQIALPDSVTDTVEIAENTINSAPACPNGFVNFGIEFHGSNATISDNTIEGNSGEGIYMESAQGVTISSDNPSAYPISGNGTDPAPGPSGCPVSGHSGIRLHTSSASRLAQNITINNLWVTGGQFSAVQFDSCAVGSQHGPAIPNVSITNNCFAGNNNEVNSGVYDFHNCVNGSASCIGSGGTNSGNQTSGCGGY